MSPRKPQALRKQQFFYAVGVGRSPGVYNSWGEIEPLVKGLCNAKFRKFPTFAQAKDFVAQCASPSRQSQGQTQTPPRTPVTPVTPITPVTPTVPVRNLDHLRERSRLVTAQIAEAPSNSLASPVNAQQSAVSVKSEIFSQAATSSQSINTQQSPVGVKSEIFSQASTSQPSDNTSSSQPIMDITKFSEFERRLLCLEENLQQTIAEKTNEIKKLKEEFQSFKSQILAKTGVNGSAGLSNTVVRLREKRAVEEETNPTKKAKLIDNDKQEPSTSNDDGSQNKIQFTYDKDGYCIVFTDGACINNGQSGARAGVGVWFGVDHPLNMAEPLEGDCPATNNNAEIQAASTALNVAKLAGVTKLCINTDSEFTINCATKWMQNWKKKGWRKADGKEVINRQQLQILDDGLEGIDVKWNHVRGHSNIFGNEMADKLANEGAAKYGTVVSI